MTPPALEDYANLDFLHLGAPTAITALALVDVLFLGFVLVQAVYLFGGSDTLARTGLTYSEYARRGFFELVTVAALVLGLILLMDWLTRFVAGRGRLIINLLHGGLIALTLLILVSALVRMRLYQQEFGLTELRFYTTAFMVWLGILLVWLAVTVLRVREPAGDNPGRRRFAFGALVASLALVVALDLINPDALIARTNLTRAAAGVGQPLDAEYLAWTLSADAVPACRGWPGSGSRSRRTDEAGLRTAGPSRDPDRSGNRYGLARGELEPQRGPARLGATLIWRSTRASVRSKGGSPHQDQAARQMGSAAVE